MLKMLHLEWPPISLIEKDKPRMVKGILLMEMIEITKRDNH